MRHRHLLFIVIIVLLSNSTFSSFAISYKKDDIRVDSSVYKRKYFTKQLISQPPKIDGKLDDACWNEIEWSDQYVQQNPKEAAKASQKTQLKILYDNKNICGIFLSRFCSIKNTCLYIKT